MDGSGIFAGVLPVTHHLDPPAGGPGLVPLLRETHSMICGLRPHARHRSLAGTAANSNARLDRFVDHGDSLRGILSGFPGGLLQNAIGGLLRLRGVVVGLLPGGGGGAR